MASRPGTCPQTCQCVLVPRQGAIETQQVHWHQDVLQAAGPRDLSTLRHSPTGGSDWHRPAGQEVLGSSLGTELSVKLPGGAGMVMQEKHTQWTGSSLETTPACSQGLCSRCRRVQEQLSLSAHSWPAAQINSSRPSGDRAAPRSPGELVLQHMSVGHESVSVLFYFLWHFSHLLSP